MSDYYDLSEMWKEGYQHERIAKERVSDAYSQLAVTGADWKLQCVVHLGTQSCKLHHCHLDEMGSQGYWSFEDIIPMCSDLNNFIQDSHSAGKEPWLDCKELELDTLKRLSRSYRIEGRLLLAYAVSRLGAFLATPHKSWKRSSYPARTLKFAARCIASLRGIRPRYGVPLATDTLARSVLEYINPNENCNRDGARAFAEILFPLAFAVGAFHRDYGDVLNASRYFDLSGELAELAQVCNPKNQEFLRLLNHRRILAEGIGDRSQAKRLTEKLDDARYGGDDVHQRLNLLQWSGRHSSDEEDAEHWLTEIKDFTSKHFTGWPIKPKLKHGVYSAWDHAGALCRIGEANRVLGESRTSASDDWSEVMAHASRVYRQGHLGVCALGRHKVFDHIAKANWSHYQGDDTFQFYFLSPRYLDYKCFRSSTEGGPFVFSELSRKLAAKIRNWLDQVSHISQSGIEAPRKS